MVLNPNYNSDDDDWDMVSPGEGEQNTAETEATAGVSEVSPSAPSSEEEELLLADSMDVPDAEEAQASKVESQTQPDTIVPSEVEEVQKDREREEEISSIPADSSVPTTKDILATNTTETSLARDLATETAGAPAEEMAPLVIESDVGAPESKPKEAAAATTTSTTPPARTFTTRPTGQKPRAASAWSLLMGSSLKKVGSALQELDEKHDLKLRQTARRSLRVVQSSAQQLGHVVETETKQVVQVVERESRKLSQSVQTKAREMELDHKVKVVEAKAFQAPSVVERKAKQIGGTLEKGVKTAGASIQSGAKSARDKAQDLNKDGKVTDILTAVAVVGAGVLLAKSASGGGGNAGAAACGAAVLGTAGAAYMANQAVQEHNTRRYEATLNEDLHME